MSAWVRISGCGAGGSIRIATAAADGALESFSISIFLQNKAVSSGMESPRVARSGRLWFGIG